eukprot:1161024-Pelagomonas_calceolata.AAC.17
MNSLLSRMLFPSWFGSARSGTQTETGSPFTSRSSCAEFKPRTQTGTPLHSWIGTGSARPGPQLELSHSYVTEPWSSARRATARR